MSKITFDSVIADLGKRKGTIKKSEFINILELIGFTVRAGKRGKHYTYSHQAFVVHPGGTFNGEHGKDENIKVPYILNCIRLMRRYEQELKEYLGESK